tara:strand:- start:29561 stop:31465 length:1905 start_codon:yes stop_codon:yes gene_type:complete
MKKEIFVDRLSIFNFLFLLRLKRNFKIFFLDDLTLSNSLLLKIFSLLKVDYEEKIFHLGSLANSDNINLYTYSLKISSDLSFKISKKLCTYKFIEDLNLHYGNKTIELYIAKKLVHYLNYYSTRILVAEKLSTEKKINVVLSRPEIFDEEDLKKEFKEVNFNFYYSPFSNTGQYIERKYSFEYFFITIFFRYFARKIFILLSSFFTNKKELLNHKNDISVMSPLENEIGSKIKYKSQFFWMNENQEKKYLLFSDSIKDIGSKKSSAKHLVINEIDNLFFKKNASSSSFNINLAKHTRRIFVKLLFNKNYISRYLLFEIYKLLSQANSLTYTVKFFGIKNFFFYKAYFPITDAIQIISKELNVSTSGFQYTDMNFASPLMMSSSDNFLIFSDLYKDVFKKNNLGPNKLISNGYPHDYLSHDNSADVKKIKNNFKKKGVNFIISYFNESEQIGKWSHHDKNFNIKLLEFLSKIILENKNIGLILKPQKNSHSIKKYKNKFITKAFETGRILELTKKSSTNYFYNLNLIYPSMAALASDISIGIAFGGTAALEAALTGKKSVLLNLTKDYYPWSEIMSKEKILFNSLDLLKIEIDKISKSDLDTNLGDWKKIINNFDNFRDSKGHERIYSFLHAINN